MPSRKSRSLHTQSSSSSSKQRKGRKEDSVSPKRHKKSDDPMPVEESVSFASSSRISASAMAATRIQRVWRSTFSHLLTLQFALKFLEREVGVQIEYVKYIRSVFLIPIVLFELSICEFYQRQLCDLFIVCCTVSRLLSFFCARSPSSPPPGTASSVFICYALPGMARLGSLFRLGMSMSVFIWQPS